jgi:hypothetical protein
VYNIRLPLYDSLEVALHPQSFFFFFSSPATRFEVLPAKMGGTTGPDTLTIPSPADFHSHLRQGELMKLVAPHVHEGGVDLAYVMVLLAYSPPPLPRIKVH